MSIIKDELKTYETMLRVYNNKQGTDEIRMEDEEAIKKLCSAIFKADGSSVSEHDLTMFNNIVVKTATTVSEPDVQQLLKYFADYENVPYDAQLVHYRKPIPKHIRFKWSSVGSGISLKRIETGTDNYIQLGQAQTGITYYPITNSATQVEDFRALVNDVAQARVQLIFEKIVALIEAGAKGGGVIPAKQCIEKGNSTLAEFDKAAGMIGRRTGSRPLFIADRDLINYYANLKTTAVGTNVPDALKSDLYNYEVTNLGSADAIPMINGYTTELGETPHFEVGVGYLVGGAASKKPLKVALAGGVTQETEKDVEMGRIKMLIRQKLGIDFLYAGNIGRVEETTVM